LRILVSHPDPRPLAGWCAALAANLGGAHVEPWRADSAPADYAVGWAVPTALFQSQPRLRGFFCAGAGVDDLLGSAAVPASLPLYRLRDAGMARQMADYCSAAVLRAVTRQDDYAAQQARGEWCELPLEARDTWTVGVFGLGALGNAVAERFRLLQFPVIGCSRQRLDSGAVDFDAFLRASRVLVLVAPLTPRTRGIVDAAALARLPRGAWLINVGRGALVDEAALLAALDAGQLAGAVLDVFAREPLPAGHPFWQHPRLRLTPHAAAFTLIEPAADQIAASIRCLEEGGTGVLTVDRVDRARGY
jgi:glyoxylate/hydroxypyruvate reductase A